jgi:hypothetical protein
VVRDESVVIVDPGERGLDDVGGGERRVAELDVPRERDETGVVVNCLLFKTEDLSDFEDAFELLL